MRDLMGDLGSRLREAPSQLYRLLGALFVLAVVLDIVVARIAGPAGHRLGLFFILVVEDAAIVAAIYAYVASVLLQAPAESYVSAMSPSGAAPGGEDFARLNQVLDSVRAQLDAAIVDNEELRGQSLGEKSVIESLRARINVLFEHSDGPLIHLDRDCNVLGITASAAELLRTTSGAAVGRPLKSVARLYDIDRDPKRERPIEQLSHLTSESGGGSKRLRSMVVFGNEDDLVLSMTVVPALDAYGVTHGAIVIVEKPVAAQRHGEELQIAPTQQGPQRDALTNLLNSVAFDIRIAELIELARRYRVSHALLLISVDELDVVNREFGSTASEEVLRQAGELVQTRVAAIGDAYRVSIYTFAALIPELSGEPARELAETLRSDVAGNAIRRGDRQFNVTASLALLEINESTEGPDVLMETANNVLLEAAVAGGNRVAVFHQDEKHQQTRRDDRGWIDWLMPRFERNLVHLVSQTIMPSGKDENTLPWVEVFVRVEEDDGHWLPPGSYLPALRRNRLTPKLDLWVLEQCLTAIGKDHAMFHKHAGLNINLDSATVASEEFRRSAAELFERSGGNGSKICFEIEEGCAANNSQQVIELIATLKPYGVHFLLDHCRSAAAIALLRRVPFDFVKFHESLVRRMMSDAVDRSEFEWLNQAAHLLGRKTVVSHVESKELCEVVTRIGVDYVQGLAIDQLGPLLI